MGVKAELKVQLWAGTVLVAESADEELWSRNFATMRGGDPSVTPHSANGKSANGGPVVPLGGSLDRFAAELGVPIASVQSACNPTTEPPYLRLDAHRWAVLKQNTPKRGPGSVPPITLAGTLLCLWFRHARPDRSASVSEAQGVLSTMQTRDQNPARALRSCPWLGRAGKLITIKPDSIGAAVELARAFCLKEPPAEEVFAGRTRNSGRGAAARQPSVIQAVEAKPTPSKSSRRNGRIAGGPKATFALMHEQGFFDVARTGREAQDHARVRFRLEVPTNNVHGKLGDLVQEGVLTRERDSDGVYRYSSARRPRGAQAAFANRQPPAAPRRASAARRKGAQSILNDLCDAGYFASPRSAVEVRTHVKHTLGHTLTTKETPKTLLRLVQAGRLTRRQGAEGEYEYIEPSRVS